jgi:hypothetical protein
VSMNLVVVASKIYVYCKFNHFAITVSGRSILTSIPGSPDTLRARTTSHKFVLQFVISQISTQQPFLTIL